jgi:hypothetical protein
VLLMVGHAYGQEAGLGAGRVEIGAFPGGGVLFMESDKAGLAACCSPTEWSPVPAEA